MSVRRMAWWPLCVLLIFSSRCHSWEYMYVCLRFFGTKPPAQNPPSSQFVCLFLFSLSHLVQCLAFPMSSFTVLTSRCAKPVWKCGEGNKGRIVPRNGRVRTTESIQSIRGNSKDFGMRLLLSSITCTWNTKQWSGKLETQLQTMQWLGVLVVLRSVTLWFTPENITVLRGILFSWECLEFRSEPHQRRRWLSKTLTCDEMGGKKYQRF